MTNAAYRLAQRLAHSAQQLNEAISTALATEDQHGLHGPWHQQLETLRYTLLPTMTPTEFADMYAQTIVYALFTARVLHEPTPTAKTPITLREHCFAPFSPWRFNSVDTYVAAHIDDCARLLERTDMTAVLRDFGKATMQHDPVIHFYETFLAAYDPKTRDMRGVYYTPEPVVSYIVRSIDHLLQTHFGKPMGLADDDTIILDPATGTATFLHAVVQHIYATLQGMGMADAWDTYVPQKLLPRLYGFEILMVPYTIAHLKLSMLLQQFGYTLGSDDCLGISLTNALADNTATAIEPPRHQARQKHAEGNIIVVLGNPPYSNYGMLNKGEWIQEQIKDYKQGLHERKLNLDDDFIKFIRFGQWRIEQTGQGILAFITNNTYIDGITHRRMRQSLMETFTDIYILDLHGSSLKKEVCPDGTPDENVFAIRQGVAIGIFIKQPGKTPPANVHHAEVWGTRAHKYNWLGEKSIATTAWKTIHPDNRWSFFVPKRFDSAGDYTQLPQLTAICSVQQNGIKTDRDSLFFDVDDTVLSERIKAFYSDAGLQSPFRETYRVQDSSSYNLLARRQKTAFNADYIRRVLYRPFDVQWLYYGLNITSRPAWDVMRHMLSGDNIALLGMRQYEYEVADYCYAFVTQHITESRIFISNRGGASMFPLYLYPDENEHPGLLYSSPATHIEHGNDYRNDYHNDRRPNLSTAFISDVEQRLGLAFIPDGVGDLRTTVGTENIFHYIYAVLHSPTYRMRYAEFLRIDFPRIPITNDKAVFATIAAHGAALVDLHLLRLPGSGGVGGAGGAAILENPGEQGITQHRVTTTPIEQIRYNKQHEQVYIANDAYFAGIAPETWAMQIGGYQPLHKWLKDRKGRTLSFDDARHYMRIAVALRETRRLMGEIDVVFR